MRVGTISLACLTLLANLAFPSEVRPQNRVEGSNSIVPFEGRHHVGAILVSSV